MNVEEAKGHSLWWLLEDEAIVDHQFEHPGDCPIEIEESSDIDGKVVWRGCHHDCAIQYIEDFLLEDYFEEYMLKQSPGEHNLNFRYVYRYYPPTYPDYEPDYDFEWEKE